MSTEKVDFNDRMLSLGLARVSEAAAIASADLVGRGDEKAADQAAVNAMRQQLNKLDIAGVVSPLSPFCLNIPSVAFTGSVIAWSCGMKLFSLSTLKPTAQSQGPPSRSPLGF